jgi:hypothetical protein
VPLVPLAPLILAEVAAPVRLKMTLAANYFC